MPELTGPHRRLLTAVAALDGEVLIHRPRAGLWQLGRDGVSARRKTFQDLADAGLIAVRSGFAMAKYVSITEAGTAAAKKRRPHG